MSEWVFLWLGRVGAEYRTAVFRFTITLPITAGWSDVSIIINSSLRVGRSAHPRLFGENKNNTLMAVLIFCLPLESVHISIPQAHYHWLADGKYSSPFFLGMCISTMDHRADSSAVPFLKTWVALGMDSTEKDPCCKCSFLKWSHMALFRPATNQRNCQVKTFFFGKNINCWNTHLILRLLNTIIYIIFRYFQFLISG